ncbi:MAG: ATP-dependent 6-phosphofructokinase [Proteobacteria bacterium]|nr:ATP-dependent 6-phosphofructokinase [Pseudomonadota bacterium]
MKIGILTGGGDAPGLNGIIEAVSRKILIEGHEVLGICDAFDGIFERQNRPITLKDVQGLHTHAGTFLGTSNHSKLAGRQDEFRKKYDELKLDGLIVAGGDGTFAALQEIGNGIPVVGVPKTIDNDLHGTDITFGFDTACTVVAEAVDALYATAEAHRRIMIVEAMGRTAGWIALGGGLASYADAILIPERPFSKEKLLKYIERKFSEGRRGLVFVVSESAHPEGEEANVAFEVPGAVQKERFGGIAQSMAQWISKNSEHEARAVVLGHLQRSRAPTTTDRFLTAAMGIEAARLVLAKQWGRCAVYKNGEVGNAPLEVLQQGARIVPKDHRWVKMVESLGLFI